MYFLLVQNTFTMNCVFFLLVLLEIHYSLQQFIDDVDCFLESNKGNTYIGKVNTRENGRSCIKWKEKPFEGYSADHNYCRNPTQHMYKPWCFSAVQGNDIWGFCNIPYCDTDCLREADKGVTYNGTVSTTAGYPEVLCVKWKDVINNTAGYREDHKFCRNPDIKDKPWCYTTTTGDWKYCNTLSCGQLCPEFPNIQNTNELNKTVEYRHPENVTVTCQTGYEMNGSSVVMCNAGKWGVLPTCIGLPCPEFPNIQNIKQLNKTIRYRHPDTVTVTCLTGYEMNGSSVIQCNAGVWSALPTCLGIRILTIEKNELFIVGISTLSVSVVAMIVAAVILYIAFLYRKRSTKKSTENYIDLQTSTHSITDPYSTLDHTEYIEIQNGR